MKSRFKRGLKVRCHRSTCAQHWGKSSRRNAGRARIRTPVSLDTAHDLGYGAAAPRVSKPTPIMGALSPRPSAHPSTIAPPPPPYGTLRRRPAPGPCGPPSASPRTPLGVPADAPRPAPVLTAGRRPRRRSAVRGRRDCNCAARQQENRAVSERSCSLAEDGRAEGLRRAAQGPDASHGPHRLRSASPTVRCPPAYASSDPDVGLSDPALHPAPAHSGPAPAHSGPAPGAPVAKCAAQSRPTRHFSRREARRAAHFATGGDGTGGDGTGGDGAGEGRGRARRRPRIQRNRGRRTDRATWRRRPGG
ncbi:hypothetical protein J2Y69_002606 [Microbacterium resistens]|uniref:Uncharacterized protein n=1 Tax=Microbacterium resistens TaxID=156977 RepID=A0ABU1SGB6_9MICO|nr:hypothetical protein [Microbacterium resistens]